MMPSSDLNLLRHGRIDYSAYVDKEAAGYTKHPFGARQTLISLIAFIAAFALILGSEFVA